MQVYAVFNRDGGGASHIDFAQLCRLADHLFSANGHRVCGCHVVGGSQLGPTLDRVAGAAEAGDVLLVGGGDGTISLAASFACRKGLILAVVPAGTMNLFARAVALPMDPERALEALAAGEVGTVDIATANQRSFVHQFSVGLHSRLVLIREGLTYRGRLGKMLASLRAMVAAVLRPPLFEIELGTGEGVRRFFASAVSVTNNLLMEGRVLQAASLDGGKLGIYIAGPMSSWAMARLCLRVLLGRWKQDGRVTELAVPAATLRFPHHKASARAVIDGELVRLSSEVVLRSHPGALRALLPRSEAVPPPEGYQASLRQDIVRVGN